MLKSARTYKQFISSRNQAVMRTLGRHMISVRECAKNNNVSISRIHKLLSSDRIPGAYQTEQGWWLIPAEWIHKRRTGHEKRRGVKVLTHDNK